jgi:hypothetical protein
MNDNDLRDCFAMFAMNGFIAKNGAWGRDVALRAWQMADTMVELRRLDTPKMTSLEDEVEVGIKTVKRTRKTNDEKD